VALFSIAYNFVNQVLAVLWAPLSGLQVPLFSRIYAQDKERAGGTLPPATQASAQLQESYTLLSKFLALALIPAGVGLALLTTNLTYVLYAKYGAASLTAIVLVVFLFAEAAISIPHNILMVYERFTPVLWSRLVSLLSIPLLLGFIPLFDDAAQSLLHMDPEDAKPFGLVGAAVAVGLARILSRLVVFIYARRSMGLRYPWAFARKVALASLAMAVAVRVLAVWLGHYPFGTGGGGKIAAALLNLGIAILGGAVFAVAFRLLGGLDEDDKRRLTRLKLPLPGWALRWL
jgi:O-antigen/teichoic acid export membrane protein